ncbi:hypothetical protein BRADI_3g10342v3 [Brachypodium distachyon]|uniref:Uncharacterized protein n=1 Tax=Brachypodium distachyon TaxID=15368 RepID=A0A2K2CWD4_BRADI|nr:hypothetical protein BRADI_3g10342v3 [Brachypodium distachyon]
MAGKLSADAARKFEKISTCGVQLCRSRGGVEDKERATHRMDHHGWTCVALSCSSTDGGLIGAVCFLRFGQDGNSDVRGLGCKYLQLGTFFLDVAIACLVQS